MKFWRGKRDAAKEAVQKIETESVPGLVALPPPALPAPSEKSLPDSDENPDEPSNVVAITSSKLSDRLAAAGLKPAAASNLSGGATLEPLAADRCPGHEQACETLENILGRQAKGSHVLVLGQPGTGRQEAVLKVLDRERSKLPRPDDWLYLAGPGRPLKAFSMPHGQGAMFAREVQSAIMRAGQTLERMFASEDYRLAAEVIDEEFRHRSDKSLDELKRRAESQNVALVKTADGFTLAPMHDGKVVRSEVFRALPGNLQREVETKIAQLETELKKLVRLQSETHLAHAEKLANLERETAARAVKPHIEAAKPAFGGQSDILDAIESAAVRAAVDAVRLRQPVCAAMETAVLAAPIHVAADFSEAAPVIVALDVSPAALLGEIGTGPNGGAAVVPGDIVRANGGYLVLDAWRLVACPEAWPLVSAVLETGQLRPRAAPGASIAADPVPVNVRVVLIAEPQTLGKLQDADPGFMRHFPSAVRFEPSAPAGSLECDAFGKLAARLASETGLRPLESGTAEIIYKDACRRAGKPERVSLDRFALQALLNEADRIAAAAGSDHIRRTDAEGAVGELEKASKL